VPRLYWEDFNPGDVAEYGPRVVAREEIIAFASEYDPQPIHLDDEAARAGMLGGLSASGWHICCVMMKLGSDAFLLDSSFMGAPGIEEVKWLSPLRPDASVTLRVHVLERRASRSRPDMGFVKLRQELVDAAGTVLMQLWVNGMFGRREPGAAVAAS
jgi:acyl dehydratase